MTGRQKSYSQKIIGNIKWRNGFSWLAVVSAALAALLALFLLALLSSFMNLYAEEMSNYGYSSLSGDIIFVYEIMVLSTVALGALLTAPFFVSRGVYRRNLKKRNENSAEEKRAIADYLMQKIASGKVGFRCSYIKGLPDFRDERTLDFLIGLLPGRRAKVRVAAMKALAGLGDYRAVAPIRALQDDKSIKVSKTAGRAVDELLLTNSSGDAGTAPAEQASQAPLDTREYTTLPYPSFSAAMRQMEEHGQPVEIVIQKAEYNEYLDAVLTFADGAVGIFGGFALNAARNDARANLLARLLESAGAADADIGAGRALPARFTPGGQGDRA